MSEIVEVKPQNVESLKVIASPEDVETFRNVGEQFEGSRKVGKHLEPPENVEEYLQVPKNSQEHFEATQNIGGYFGASENVESSVNIGKHIEASENALTHSEASENVVTHLESSENVVKHSEALESVGEWTSPNTGERFEALQNVESSVHIGTSENLVKHSEASENVGEYLEVPKNARERFEVSQNSGECSEASENVESSVSIGEHIEASENVVKPSEASENVIKHLEASESVGEYLEAPKNPREHFEPSQNTGEHFESSVNIGKRIGTSENMVKRSEASENVLKHSEASENVVKHLKVSERVGEYLEELKNAREHFEVSQDTEEHLEASENLVKHLEPSENMIKHSEVSESVGEYLVAKKVPKTTRGHFEASQNTGEHFESSVNIRKHTGASENVVKHSEASENVVKRSETSENVIKHSGALESVGEHLEVPETASEHFEASQNTGERFESSINVESSLNIGKYIEAPGNVVKHSEHLVVKLSEASESIGEYLEVPKNARQHLETSQSAGERFETSENVESSVNIGKHIGASENVAQHSEASENVMKYSEASENLMKYSEVSESIEKYLEVQKSAGEHYEASQKIGEHLEATEDIEENKKKMKLSNIGASENVELLKKHPEGSENVLKHSETSENVAKHSEASENVGEYLEVPKNAREHFEVSQNIAESFEASENVKSSVKIGNASENVAKHSEASENVVKYSEASENVEKHLQTSESVGEYLEVPKNAREHFEASQNTAERFKASEHVGSSVNIGEHIETSQNVIKHSDNLMVKLSESSDSAGEYLEAPNNFREYFKAAQNAGEHFEASKNIKSSENIGNTTKNVANHSEVSENVMKHSEVSKSLEEYLEVPKKTREHLEASQNAGERFEASENVESSLNLSVVSETVGEYLEVSENASEYFKTSQNSGEQFKASENVGLIKASANVGKYLEAPEHIGERFESPENVVGCIKASANVGIYLEAPENIGERFESSVNVAEHIKVSGNARECFEAPENPGERIDSLRDSGEPLKPSENIAERFVAPKNISECFVALENIPERFLESENVAECFVVSENIPVHFEASQNDEGHFKTSQNVALQSSVTEQLCRSGAIGKDALNTNQTVGFVSDNTPTCIGTESESFSSESLNINNNEKNLANVDEDGHLEEQLNKAEVDNYKNNQAEDIHQKGDHHQTKDQHETENGNLQTLIVEDLIKDDHQTDVRQTEGRNQRISNLEYQIKDDYQTKVVLQTEGENHQVSNVEHQIKEDDQTKGENHQIATLEHQIRGTDCLAVNLEHRSKVSHKTEGENQQVSNVEYQLEDDDRTKGKSHQLVALEHQIKGTDCLAANLEHHTKASNKIEGGNHQIPNREHQTKRRSSKTPNLEHQQPQTVDDLQTEERKHQTHNLVHQANDGYHTKAAHSFAPQTSQNVEHLNVDHQTKTTSGQISRRAKTKLRSKTRSNLHQIKDDHQPECRSHRIFNLGHQTEDDLQNKDDHQTKDDHQSTGDHQIKDDYKTNVLRQTEGENCKISNIEHPTKGEHQTKVIHQIEGGNCQISNVEHQSNEDQQTKRRSSETSNLEHQIKDDHQPEGGRQQISNLDYHQSKLGDQTKATNHLTLNLAHQTEVIHQREGGDHQTQPKDECQTKGRNREIRNREYQTEGRNRQFRNREKQTKGARSERYNFEHETKVIHQRAGGDYQTSNIEYQPKEECQTEGRNREICNREYQIGGRNCQIRNREKQTKDTRSERYLEHQPKVTHQREGGKHQTPSIEHKLKDECQTEGRNRGIRNREKQTKGTRSERYFEHQTKVIHQCEGGNYQTPNVEHQLKDECQTKGRNREIRNREKQTKGTRSERYNLERRSKHDHQPEGRKDLEHLIKDDHRNKDTSHLAINLKPQIEDYKRCNFESQAKDDHQIEGRSRKTLLSHKNAVYQFETSEYQIEASEYQTKAHQTEDGNYQTFNVETPTEKISAAQIITPKASETYEEQLASFKQPPHSEELGFIPKSKTGNIPPEDRKELDFSICKEIIIPEDTTPSGDRVELMKIPEDKTRGIHLKNKEKLTITPEDEEREISSRNKLEIPQDDVLYNDNSDVLHNEDHHNDVPHNDNLHNDNLLDTILKDNKEPQSDSNASKEIAEKPNEVLDREKSQSDSIVTNERTGTKKCLREVPTSSEDGASSPNKLISEDQHKITPLQNNCDMEFPGEENNTKSIQDMSKIDKGNKSSVLPIENDTTTTLDKSKVLVSNADREINDIEEIDSEKEEEVATHEQPIDGGNNKEEPLDTLFDTQVFDGKTHKRNRMQSKQFNGKAIVESTKITDSKGINDEVEVTTTEGTSEKDNLTQRTIQETTDLLIKTDDPSKSKPNEELIFTSSHEEKAVQEQVEQSRKRKLPTWESPDVQEEHHKRIKHTTDETILEKLPQNISSLFKREAVVKVGRIVDMKSYRKKYVESMRNQAEEANKNKLKWSSKSKGRSLDAIVDKLVSSLKNNEIRKRQGFGIGRQLGRGNLEKENYMGPLESLSDNSGEMEGECSKVNSLEMTSIEIDDDERHENMLDEKQLKDGIEPKDVINSKNLIEGIDLVEKDVIHPTDIMETTRIGLKNQTRDKMQPDMIQPEIIQVDTTQIDIVDAELPQTNTIQADIIQMDIIQSVATQRDAIKPTDIIQPIHITQSTEIIQPIDITQPTDVIQRTVITEPTDVIQSIDIIQSNTIHPERIHPDMTQPDVTKPNTIQSDIIQHDEIQQDIIQPTDLIDATVAATNVQTQHDIPLIEKLGTAQNKHLHFNVVDTLTTPDKDVKLVGGVQKNYFIERGENNTREEVENMEIDSDQHLDTTESIHVITDNTGNQEGYHGNQDNHVTLKKLNDIDAVDKSMGSSVTIQKVEIINTTGDTEMLHDATEGEKERVDIHTIDSQKDETQENNIPLNDTLQIPSNKPNKQLIVIEREPPIQHLESTQQLERQKDTSEQFEISKDLEADGNVPNDENRLLNLPTQGVTQTIETQICNDKEIEKDLSAVPVSSSVIEPSETLKNSCPDTSSPSEIDKPQQSKNLKDCEKLQKFEQLPIDDLSSNNQLLNECTLKVRPAKELLEKYKFMQDESYDTSSSDYELATPCVDGETPPKPVKIQTDTTTQLVVTSDSSQDAVAIETTETVIEDSYVDQSIPMDNDNMAPQEQFPVANETNKTPETTMEQPVQNTFENNHLLFNAHYPNKFQTNILDYHNQPISHSILNVSFDADQFLSDVMLDKRLPYLESCSDVLGNMQASNVDVPINSPHTKVVPTLEEHSVMVEANNVMTGSMEKMTNIEVEEDTSSEMNMINGTAGFSGALSCSGTIDVDDPQLAEKVKSMGFVKIGSESSDHDYINYGGPLLVGKYEQAHNNESPEMSPSRQVSKRESFKDLDDLMFSFVEQVSIGAHTENVMVPVSSHDSLVNNVAEQYNSLSYNFMDTQDYNFMNKMMANVLQHQTSIADTSGQYENNITFSNDNLLSSTRIDDTNGPDFTINSFPLSDLALCDIEDFYGTESISPDKIIVNPLKTLHTIPKSVIDVPQKVTVKVNEYEFASTDNMFKDDSFACPSTPKLNTSDSLIVCVKKAKDKEVKKEKVKTKAEKKMIELDDVFPIRRNTKTPVSAPKLHKKKDDKAEKTSEIKDTGQEINQKPPTPEVATTPSPKKVMAAISKQSFLENILSTDFESQEELEMKPDKLAKLIFATFDDTDLLNVDSPNILESPTRVTVKINEYEYASTDNLYNMAYSKNQKLKKVIAEKPKPVGKKLQFPSPKKTETPNPVKPAENKIETDLKKPVVVAEEKIEQKPVVPPKKIENHTPLPPKTDDAIQVKKNKVEEGEDNNKKKEVLLETNPKASPKVVKEESKPIDKEKVAIPLKDKESTPKHIKIPKIQQERSKSKEQMEDGEILEPTKETRTSEPSREKTSLLSTTFPPQKYQSEVQRWRPEVPNQYHPKIKSSSSSSSSSQYPRLSYAISQRSDSRSNSRSMYIRKEESSKPSDKPGHHSSTSKSYYQSSSSNYPPQTYYPRQDSRKYDRPPSRTEQRKPSNYSRPDRLAPSSEKSYWEHKNSNRLHQSRSERITGNDYQKQNDQRSSASYNRISQSRSERNLEPQYPPLDAATFTRNKYDEIKRRSYEKSLRNQVKNTHEGYYQILDTNAPPERQKRKSPTVEHNGIGKMRKFDEERKEGQTRKRGGSPNDDGTRKRQKEYDEIFSKLREEGNINKNFKLKFPSPSDNSYNSSASQSSSNDNWFEKFPEQFFLKEARYVTFGGVTKRSSDKHS